MRDAPSTRLLALDHLDQRLRRLLLEGLAGPLGVERHRDGHLHQLDVEAASGEAHRGLGRRWKQLDEEVGVLDRQLAVLVKKVAPGLVALRGIGADVAGSLLVAAGDNPERLANEASFASMCGVSPIDASSGKKHRHRLNRGGNRDANRALWVVALVRLRCDPRTRTYVARRTAEGLSKPEILRCLKRYIAREVFKILQASSRATADLAIPLDGT